MTVRKEGDSCTKGIYYKEEFNKSHVGKTWFNEWSYNIVCTHSPVYSKVINMAYAREISIFISNYNECEISYKFQCSPDNVNFIDDGDWRKILPGESTVLVPMYFAKYGRVKIISKHRISVSIHVQQQIYGE